MRILVGIIGSPFGVKGFVRIKSYSDNPKRFSPGQAMSLDSGNSHRIVKIEKSRISGDCYIAKLEGVDDRNAAADLKGAELSIESSQLPKKEQDEFWEHELIEMHVLDEKRNYLGNIVEIIETKANDVYVVRKQDGAEFCVPAIKQVVLCVDVKEREMTIRPIAGML